MSARVINSVAELLEAWTCNPEVGGSGFKSPL